MSTPLMLSGYGKFHTNEPGAGKRRPYATITMDAIRRMVDSPQQVDKSEAQWLIPSTLLSRNWKQQEQAGAYWWLWADLDAAPPPLAEAAFALDFIVLGQCQYEVYASRSATAERQKSRILIPLGEPLWGGDWVLTQKVLNDKLAALGIVPDRANEGAGQLCYLPNKGEYYSSVSNRDGACFDPLKVWVAEIAEKRRAVDEKAAAVEARRLAAAERREALQYSGEQSAIEAFNECFSVEEILLRAGYDQDGDRFRHPQSESGSFSASVKDGRVHSLSERDPLWTGGSGGGAHDSFSAFSALFAGGDRDEALKLAGDQWLKIGDESWNAVKRREYREQQVGKLPPLSIVPLSTDEIAAARLTPRVILPDFLYADVRVRIAAGGVGKTTLALFEAVVLAQGKPLWGSEPAAPVRTCIVTREDSREILVARLREVMNAQWLEPDEVAAVLDNVVVVDCSGINFRLSRVDDDVVVPHVDNLNRLVEALQEWRPDWIIFDPLVSFGVGESRVNDAEQGLIESFRIVRNNLDCCVEAIHHSGKANAREKAVDQYAGRGGSALADGARMVAVLQPLEPHEWHKQTGTPLAGGESGIVMALPKLSFARAPEAIYIKRSGYLFSQVAAMRQSTEQEGAALADRLFRFIADEYAEGRLYSKEDLRNARNQIGLSRAQVDAAATYLKVSGKVVYHETKGKAGSHFEPIGVAKDGGDTQAENLAIVVDSSLSLAA